MSANAIWFEQSDKKFYFDGQPVTQNKVGRLISAALVNGQQDVDFDYCSVTVNYLVEMLRWTGKNGWFFDVLDHTSDHRFDRNTPTPGGRFGEAQDLNDEARLLLRKAAELRTVTVLAIGQDHLLDTVEQLERDARDLQSQAKRVLTPSDARIGPADAGKLSLAGGPDLTVRLPWLFSNFD